MNEGRLRPAEGPLPRVAAVVVLYHPDPASLQKLIESAAGQVQSIYVVDNTPAPNATVSTFLSAMQSVTYLPLGRNVGIAAAQNVGIRRSTEADFTHVLLLDQDSALPPNMVADMLSGEDQLLREGRQVAAVGPQFYDVKTGKAYPAVRLEYFRIRKLHLDTDSTEPVEADYLIASGSMIRTSVLNAVGLMREDLFIDWVDVEWGLRARNMGFRSYHIPSVMMAHDVGDAVVTIFGRDVHVHNDVRNYYMLRNALYLYRLKSMGRRWKITFLPRIPCYLLLYPFLADDRLKNLRCVIRALRDGLAGRMGAMRQERHVQS